MLGNSVKEYHKIDSVYKRDTKGKFILGEFARPEFEYLKDNPWLWTEKIDGTNIRIMWDGTDVRYGGRTDNAQLPNKLVNWLNEHLFGYTFFNLFGSEGNVCLYGEGYGAGIQKGGGNYSSEQKFILFDVKIGNFWLSYDNVTDIGNKLGLEVVPLEGIATLSEMINVVQKGLTSISHIGNANKEGYVGTPSIPLFARNGDRIITKIKYKDFNL